MPGPATSTTSRPTSRSTRVGRPARPARRTWPACADGTTGPRPSPAGTTGGSPIVRPVADHPAPRTSGPARTSAPTASPLPEPRTHAHPLVAVQLAGVTPIPSMRITGQAPVQRPVAPLGRLLGHLVGDPALVGVLGKIEPLPRPGSADQEPVPVVGPDPDPIEAVET